MTINVFGPCTASGVITFTCRAIDRKISCLLDSVHDIFIDDRDKESSSVSLVRLMDIISHLLVCTFIYLQG
jgi:hypothetical protein